MQFKHTLPPERAVQEAKKNAEISSCKHKPEEFYALFKSVAPAHKIHVPYETQQNQRTSVHDILD